MIKHIGGVVQHYAWGGFHFLPQILGIENKERRPYAELWFGDHTGGNSPVLDAENNLLNLGQYIDKDALSLLGEKTFKDYDGRLPFLLKILDVHNMLSIQAHPTKEAAIQGFLQENQQNISLNAPNRIFKDKNPKPEMMVALSPFWLLHGFLSIEKAVKNLKSIPSLAFFADIYEKEGIKNGYRKWMELPQQEVDALLQPLKLQLDKRLITDIDKNTPEYWAKKAFIEFPPKEGHFDRGIFSIFVMNLVHLQPGEAIFQDTGLLHAYLEGINIELMVNSDNVFRGGLTDKYMNIPLLLRHLDFNPTNPSIIKPVQDSPNEKKFIIPSTDFELKEYELSKNEDFLISPNDGPAILLCLKGSIGLVGSSVSVLNPGEAFFVPHKTQIHIKQTGEFPALLFKAGIPKKM